jgi:hypothetical protein
VLPLPVRAREQRQHVDWPAAADDRRRARLHERPRARDGARGRSSADSDRRSGGTPTPGAAPPAGAAKRPVPQPNSSSLCAPRRSPCSISRRVAVSS